MRAEELKGHLDAMLLAALESGPRHGYAVIETLRHSTGGRLDLPTGTIYPALRRLEQAGLITGSWSVVGGRRAARVPADPGRGPGPVRPPGGLAGFRRSRDRRAGGNGMPEPEPRLTGTAGPEPRLTGTAGPEPRLTATAGPRVAGMPDPGPG